MQQFARKLARRYPALGELKRQITHAGLRRYCPICQSHVRSFLSHGLVPRPNARCPVCGSLERHRHTWLYMQCTNLFDEQPKTMLHIAPEAMFATRLRKIPNLRYITADLLRHNVTERIDLTTIPHPNNTFDISYCSHVLEHIPDDYQAMRELYRVLKPGGWALIDVPITADITVEDPSITDPQERERLFGQHDHVRRYGSDVVERLQQAGFQVQKIFPTNLVPGEKLKYMGLIMQPFFICMKWGAE